jgi:hypothetical protein
MKSLGYFVLLLGTAIYAGGCGTGSATPIATAEPAPTPPTLETVYTSDSHDTALIDGIDACSVLPNEDFSAVQGEKLIDAKGSQRREGGLAVSQCFLLAPTYSKSVSLVISRASKDGVTSFVIKEKWDDIFHQESADRDRDEEDEKDAVGEPIKVRGIGDEAYWTGNARGGALYVLAKNSIIRLSLGGSDAQNQRIEKAKRLAKNIVKRLSA